MKADRKLTWVLAAGALALCTNAIAQAPRDAPRDAGGNTTQESKSQPSRDAGKTSMSRQDAKMLEELARANMTEVALGRLAEQKAASDDVKKFGKHMVDDHGKMLDQGEKVAKSKNVEPPSAPDRTQQASQKKLEGLSGEQFDRAFMDQMVKDHEQALKLVRQAAQKASDPELKAMAKQATPEIEKHLKMARDLASRTKSQDGQAAASSTKSTKGK